MTARRIIGWVMGGIGMALIPDWKTAVGVLLMISGFDGNNGRKGACPGLGHYRCHEDDERKMK